MPRASARLSARPSPVNRRREAASWLRSVAPRLLAPISTSPVPAKKDVKPKSDALPARYQHHQQHHEASSFRVSSCVDGRASRRGSVHCLADSCRNPPGRSGEASGAIGSKPGSQDRRDRKPCSLVACSPPTRAPAWSGRVSWRTEKRRVDLVTLCGHRAPKTTTHAR